MNDAAKTYLRFFAMILPTEQRPIGLPEHRRVATTQLRPDLRSRRVS
ncbi:MAG: hypothetical protein ACNA8N_11865 [Trueperaceae bacterium]